jgi:LmbE family N-acetylglucosaminyl deacetylase
MTAAQVGRKTRAAARRALLSATVSALDRLRPVAPPAVWFSLVAMRSAVGTGPVLTRPQARRALVLAPHPDDETIGVGGSVALLADAGADVRVLTASCGEASVANPAMAAAATAAARAGELACACAILGASLIDVLGLPDGDLGHHQAALTASINTVLVDFRPDIVFVPWPLDDHPDHVAVCRALAAAVALPVVSEVWCYEVWTALPPNRMVDISAWWDRKRDALRAHHSAGASFDPTAHLALSRWRSIAALSGAGHAEAFMVLRPDQFRQLVEGTHD